ncbi:MAG TPA: hypothetical protein VEM13_12780 [Gemmatimonadales bacterium]|nr:hypothetical protein [Gemmatimonadales bacterium]
MIRSTLLRIPLLTALVGALSAAPRPQPMVTFRSSFAGVAADRQHCTWEGTVDGAARGHITIALRQVEEPAAAANPIWHVASTWTVRDETGVHSFSANLEGMVDWKAGTLRLGGAVADGWLAGSWVEVDSRIVNGDLVGSLSIIPAVAHR